MIDGINLLLQQMIYDQIACYNQIWVQCEAISTVNTVRNSVSMTSVVIRANKVSNSLIYNIEVEI